MVNHESTWEFCGIELTIFQPRISLNYDNLKFSWTDRISESGMIYLKFENIISGLGNEQILPNTLHCDYRQE